MYLNRKLIKNFNRLTQLYGRKNKSILAYLPKQIVLLHFDLEIEEING